MIPGTNITLEIRCPCNFYCSYCVSGNLKDITVLYNLNKLNALYQNTHSFTVTSLDCRASEPAIHPQIKEILLIAAEHGAVSLPTNNSISPQHWLPKNITNRIMIRAALHPQGEENLDRFVNYSVDIKNQGGKISIVYVMHPNRISKMEKYKELFAKHEIQLVPTPFKGKYEGKIFPEDYSPEERSLMYNNSEDWYTRLSMETPIRDFFMIPCLCGYSDLYYSAECTLRRCSYDNSILEKPFDHPAPCKMFNCGCGLFLKELNNTHTIQWWNIWRTIAGWDLLPEVENETQQEIYAINKDKYWHLMMHYQKLYNSQNRLLAWNYFIEKGEEEIRQNNFPAAEKTILKAMEISLKSEDTKNQMAITLEKLADVCSHLGQFQNAIDLYLNAMNKNQIKSNNDADRLGNLYRKLSDLYEKNNNIKLSELFLCKSIDVLVKLHGKDNDGTQEAIKQLIHLYSLHNKSNLAGELQETLLKNHDSLV